jgi:hypothetical protein
MPRRICWTLEETKRRLEQLELIPSRARHQSAEARKFPRKNGTKSLAADAQAQKNIETCA